jgi:hypothetical protein
MGDTKSNDKKMTLLNYFVQLVESRFPEVLNWYTEVPAVEVARKSMLFYVLFILKIILNNIPVPLGGMQQDMRELKEGIASVGQEIELTPDDEPNAVFKAHVKVLIY